MKAEVMGWMLGAGMSRLIIPGSEMSFTMSFLLVSLRLLHCALPLASGNPRGATAPSP